MKYYTIDGPELIHGQELHDGLNNAKLPVYLTHDGYSGGINFAKEDVLALMYMGDELFEVDPVSSVFESKCEPHLFRSNDVILKRVGSVRENIKFLVEQGANVHVWYDVPLINAAHKNDFELVRFFVERGADVNAWRGLPLLRALENQNFTMAKYLIENGANIEESNEPLINAVLRRDLASVKFLIRQGATGNILYALRLAVEQNAAEIVLFLIKDTIECDFEFKNLIEKKFQSMVGTC